MEVFEDHVGNGKWGWIEEAERKVGLPITLVDFDGVVYLINKDGVVGNVVDSTIAASSLKIPAESCG